MKRTLLVKDLPWPGVKLSQNGRSHWSAKAALVKAARQEAFVKAKQELMGQPATLKSGTRLNVQLIIQPPDRRRRDESNMVERCKSFFDGIADALNIDDCFFHHREQIWLDPKMNDKEETNPLGVSKFLPPLAAEILVKAAATARLYPEGCKERVAIINNAIRRVKTTFGTFFVQRNRSCK